MTTTGKKARKRGGTRHAIKRAYRRASSGKYSRRPGYMNYVVAVQPATS